MEIILQKQQKQLEIMTEVIDLKKNVGFTRTVCREILIMKSLPYIKTGGK